MFDLASSRFASAFATTAASFAASASRRAVQLVHQFTSGIAGWLTFEQMRRGTDNSSESTLYKPLEEIAYGRHFEVKQQFAIPKKAPTRGAQKTIDFVVVDRAKQAVLALEVKYKRPGRKMAGSLSEDALKLRDFTLLDAEQTINSGKGGNISDSVAGFKLTKAVLFVWRKDDGVRHIVATEEKPIRSQLHKLVEKMLPDELEFNAKNLAECFLAGKAAKPVGSTYGGLRSGSTISNQRFWVATFIECDLWKSL